MKILEKSHKNQLLRYSFVVYFIQTSMCYYMSQNLIKIYYFWVFLNKFFKIRQKAQPGALKLPPNP